MPNPETFYLKMGHTNPTTTLNYYVDMSYVMEQRRIELYKQRAQEIAELKGFQTKNEEKKT
jgi:hypothetical protein